jgi:hypothetical protein
MPGRTHSARLGECPADTQDAVRRLMSHERHDNNQPGNGPWTDRPADSHRRLSVCLHIRYWLSNVRG